MKEQVKATRRNNRLLETA